MFREQMRLGWLGVLIAVSMLPARGAVVFDWAVVGDPGNAADATGYGAVARIYVASKYEVTNAQYAEFLNKVRPNGSLPGEEHPLYPGPAAMIENQGVTGIVYLNSNPAGSQWVVKAGHENKPVTFVSALNAARFVNWLSNGQGSGGIDSGSYAFDGTLFTRNPGATVFLPTADEWYKAAFYKGGGTNAGYWRYANLSDTAPMSGTPGTAGAANFFRDDMIDNGINGGFAMTGSRHFDTDIDYLSDVGAYTATAAPHGIFDLVGNLNEWTELLVNHQYRSAGGGFPNILEQLDTGVFPAGSPSGLGIEGHSDTGFRVFAAIPEPGGALIALASLALVAARGAGRRGSCHAVRSSRRTCRR